MNIKVKRCEHDTRKSVKRNEFGIGSQLEFGKAKLQIYIPNNHVIITVYIYIFQYLYVDQCNILVLAEFYIFL